PRASKTPHAPDPTDTAQTLASDDSNLRPSECARVASQSQHRDPKYNPHASSDESRVSKSRARARPTPEYPCVAAAARNHSPQAPTLPSSRPRSDDRHSSKSYRPSSENLTPSLLPQT